MNKNQFQSSDWYRAISLRERITSLPIQKSKGDLNAELASRKLQQWQSQEPFKDNSFFTKRLEIDNITEAEFLDFLGESIDAVKARFTNQPTWLIEFEQAFYNSKTSDILSKIISDSELVTLQFLYAITPLLNQALERLSKEIQGLIDNQENLPFDPKHIESILLNNLPKQLMAMLSKTMVLELNVARLQGVLTDNTSEERFQSFIERLKERDFVINLFQEYPVLARQITIYIDHWLKFSVEFIQHLCQDWQAICDTFSPEHNPGLLVGLQIGAGDSHRQGRSVILAQFESGLKLVYKPKNLSVDLHFQQLLAWLNERGDHPPFQLLKILNQDSYGWVEFIEAKTCTAEAELERFYQRQGGYLALFYTLEATDFHSENLIAAGEQPMMIDLEVLFHPYRGEIDVKESELLAGNQMTYSVLRVGLLPQKNWGNNESEGVDISGLGALPGQLTPKGVPTWEGMGTDEMKLIRKRIEISGSQNRPSLNNNDVDILGYTKAIIKGFISIYQLLLKHRHELLSSNSPLVSFANDEVRVVLRSTNTYAKLLWESFHPDLLRNALDRDRFYDRLWLDVKYRSELEKVIVAEQEDLWQGDIPIFTTYPNSCDLWTSTKSLIPNFFNQSGLELVKSQIEKLGQQDLERQIWFIQASLATLVMGDVSEKIVKYSFPKSNTQVEENLIEKTLTERLLKNACAIGDRLEILALRGQEDATWLGLNLVSEKQWSVLPVGIDLYDGISGVVLFLAHLGAITQESRYNALAESAFKTLQRQVKLNQDSIRSIGGFSGWGGIIYTLTHLGILWEQPTLLAQAEELVNLLPPLIAEDEQLDIIGGAAGCLASLLTLYRHQPTAKILDTAIQCGERLLSQTQPMSSGVGWLLKDIVQVPLSGFSHGVAGIAWVLLELFGVTGEPRFEQTARDGIIYERSLFYPPLANWLDLRTLGTQNPENEHTCMTAWCHGAPGIGLARLRCLPYIDDLAIRAEIQTAIETTLKQGFGFNHSLCHGDLGNLELLLQASTILNHPKYHTQVNSLSNAILESISQQGWLCGVPLGVETPGLMTGLAGIGYELLRLAEPKLVPSVLILET